MVIFLREAGGAASVARTPPHPGVNERRLAALLDDHALPDVCVCLTWRPHYY